MRVVISTEDDLKHRTGHGWISIFESVAGLPNDLLDGSVHQDTVAEAVLRGKLIIGNSTPAWAGLAIGAAGDILGSDGIDPAWRKFRLVTDGATFTSAADTLEQTAKSLTISANTIGANGLVNVTFILRTAGTAGTKTFRLKLGGTTFISGVIAASTVTRILFTWQFFNQNATNSQFHWETDRYNSQVADTDQHASISRRWNTGAIDTTADAVLAITLQKAASGDTTEIIGFYVSVIK